MGEGLEVGPDDTPRLVGLERAAWGEPDHRAERPDLGAARVFHPRRGCDRVGVFRLLQPRDVADERRKRRGRADDEFGQRVAAAARLEVPLPEVEQVASGLALAGEPEVGGVDAQAVEHVGARHDDMAGRHIAELQRKRVQRGRELVGGPHDRRGEAGVVPGAREGATGVEVGRVDALHDDERRRRARRTATREQDERPEPAAEHVDEVALERANGFGNGHVRVLYRDGVRAALPACTMRRMRLRELNVGCFGGGTGLPSLLGGLKTNPWVRAHGVVTMFDSGGSSGVLRDELGVLPPGDILKCALALARNSREARRVLLARLPTLEHARLGGHTGGNLLLSMMQRYSGDFLDAVDGLRALLGCTGRVWPVSVQQASVCAEYGDGSVTRGEVEVDAGQSSGRFVERIWLEPQATIHPLVAEAIARFDAVIIGPGSFYTSLMPIFLVDGVADALARMKGPVVLVANLLTEGRGMAGFTAADEVERLEAAIKRPVDVVIANVEWPSPSVLDRYAEEHKEPLQPGRLPGHCELVGGEFWTGEIARHNRLRLAYAVWAVLSRRLLGAAERSASSW